MSLESSISTCDKNLEGLIPDFDLFLALYPDGAEGCDWSLWNLSGDCVCNASQGLQLAWLTGGIGNMCSQ